MSRIPFFGRFFRRVGPVASQEIREPVAVVVSAPVSASEPATDWRSMTYPQQRSLAAEHSVEPVRNGDDVRRVLAAKFG